MITWHGGLFLTMLLGQIGVQGRKQARLLRGRYPRRVLRLAASLACG
jgi:hypothetical protein